MEVLQIFKKMTLNIIFISIFSRSLDRPRRPLASGAMASDSSAACSDSETSNLGNRASVPSLDKKDLQRAVAHLQETLQQRMTMQPHTHSGHGGSNPGHPLGNTSDQQVKAVVHRGPESRTLDGQSIKQYESIKRNQVPYGNWELGPYDTIKPSR